MKDQQELANKIYEAARGSSRAFYQHNQKDFTYWRNIYDELTEGITPKQAMKLADQATLEFRQSLEGLSNA